MKQYLTIIVMAALAIGITLGTRAATVTMALVTLERCLHLPSISSNSLSWSNKS